MLLEVIATSVEDAVIAEQSGADRIELISGITEGGVTPSLGLVELVLHKVKIPVHVMIRPHANSFEYSHDDIKVMKRDIGLFTQLGVKGIVLGALTSNHEIDHYAMNNLLEDETICNVTFHRAFDQLSDQMKGLHELSKYPMINRVLTSGGKNSALDAIPQLQQLVQESCHFPITILAGSGLVNEKLKYFIEATQVQEVHMGTGVRQNGLPLKSIDPSRLLKAVNIIKNSF